MVSARSLFTPTSYEPYRMIKRTQFIAMYTACMHFIIFNTIYYISIINNATKNIVFDGTVLIFKQTSQ